MLPLHFKDFYTLTFVDLGYYNPNDPMLGLINCPGLICMKTNKPIMLGDIMKEGQGFTLWDIEEYNEMTDSNWIPVLNKHRSFLSYSEYLIDSNIPTEHKDYFRALNFYRRILPENSLVHELFGIYWDGGLLTHAQRGMVDNELHLGSDSGELINSFENLRLLEMLAALGAQPGLDQTWVRALITQYKTRYWNYEESPAIFEKLEQFSDLIKPLSAELISHWPPKDRILSLP